MFPVTIEFHLEKPFVCFKLHVRSDHYKGSHKNALGSDYHKPIHFYRMMLLYHPWKLKIDAQLNH